MTLSKLVPEFVVLDISASQRFYTQVLSFTVLYERAEERFVYLEREGAELMLEEVGGRSFVEWKLERPYGRGVNLQIAVGDVKGLYGRVVKAGVTIVLPLEERWYRRERELVGNRQFVVQDPDGYVLRFAQELGRRAGTV